jgi:HSP20 family protein
MAKESKEVTRTEKGREVQPVSSARALSPFEEMDQLFERFFPRGWLQPFRREWPSWGELAMPFEGRLPRVDVIDRDEEVVVRAEIPGVDKKDLEVSVTENTVTIRGTTGTEEEEEKGDYYRREISRGAFSRTVMLPSEVNGEKAKAFFKEGTLELIFPKVEKSKRHKIKVE